MNRRVEERTNTGMTEELEAIKGLIFSEFVFRKDGVIQKASSITGFYSGQKIRLYTLQHAVWNNDSSGDMDGYFAVEAKGYIDGEEILGKDKVLGKYLEVCRPLEQSGLVKERFMHADLPNEELVLKMFAYMSAPRATV